MAVTPDGRQAISASWDKHAQGLGPGQRPEVRTLQGHTDCGHRRGGDARRPQAVSASWDNTLKVWDLASGAEVRTLRGHTAGSTAWR